MNLTLYCINPSEIISYVAFLTQLLPVVLYLVFRSKIKDDVLRVIALILVIGFCCDVLSILLSARKVASYGIVNTFTLLETLALLYFFYYLLIEKVVRICILLFSVIFTIYWLTAFYHQGTTGFIEAINVMESFAIIPLSAYYFFERIKKTETLLIYTEPVFWVVIAYLIYTSGTFFLFLYMEDMKQVEQRQYFILNSISIILKTVLLSIAMVKKDRTKIKNLNLLKSGQTA